MKVMTIGWLSVFLAIFLMNLYIWHQYWKIPFRESRFIKAMSYFLVHISLTIISVYYFYLFFNGQTDTKKSTILSYIAGFYLTFLHYSMLMYLVHDLVYLTRNLIPYSEKVKAFSERLFFGGFIIFGIAAIISIFSIYNSKKITIKNYDLTLDKKESSIEELNIVYISDGHICTSVTKNNIGFIVDKINKLNPDIVFLGGDFFDEGTTESDKILASKELGSIESKYGVYAIEGNHEYKSGNSNINDQMQYLRDGGVVVLQDEIAKIDNSFYILGRKDRHGDMKTLEEVIGDMKIDLPMIALDHRPSYKDVKEIKAIDLQLSGHTHSGQFFPLQILDPLLGRITKQYMYGHHKIDNLDVIVSSGVGDWGIPVRIGSKREILNIKVKFE